MAVLGEIRKRPILLMGVIALALLAFLVNPDTIDSVLGKNPNILGKVNGEKITREEYNDQLYMLQMQAQQQGMPSTGLEEQAWQQIIQSKIVAQEFEKLGFTMTEYFFWNQLQYIPFFQQNPENFDAKGNFKTQEVKRQIEELQNNPQNPEAYSNWLKYRKFIEQQIMARQLALNVNNGLTTSKKEAEFLLKQNSTIVNIDYVKIDLANYIAKNKIPVTDKDIEEHIKKYPLRYKTDASVDIAAVHFPATASASDQAATQKEMEKLVRGEGENLQNTQAPSSFVMAHSDASFDDRYFSINELPPSMSNWVANASVGQVFGPIKEGNALIASKLLDKKAKDSILSKHILIAYKGAERSKANRTKEQAKKTADSLFALVKNNAEAFNQNAKLSDEPGAAERNGSLGWVTPDTPFDATFMQYLTNNPKGATGLVETPFGYHIINIEDKKQGNMGYKLANIVRRIRPSEATEAELDKNARRFIQQAEGKSLNEFLNIAKKSNFKNVNPKNVTRFQGIIPGVETGKDADIIKWAFNKKRKKGDTEMFIDEGTGDRIIVMMNTKHDKGLAQASAVRAQVEMSLRNEIAAKKLATEISAGNLTTLDQIAKKYGAIKNSTQVGIGNGNIEGTLEPKVVGAAIGIAKNKLSTPIEGKMGVYVLVKTNETTTQTSSLDVKRVMENLSEEKRSMFLQQLMSSLQANADIKDYRLDVWDKVAQ